MGAMYCSRCHKFGIYWSYIGTYNEHTYCPHCRGINCQQFDEIVESEEIEEGY